MSNQSYYVDANCPYVGTDMHTVSASPSYPYSYEQKPIEDRRFHTRQTDPSSHASATPDYRPMNNMGYSVDQHGTLHRLEDVSRFYSSDKGIGYGSASYVAGYSQPSYSQPSYTSPHQPNLQSPY